MTFGKNDRGIYVAADTAVARPAVSRLLTIALGALAIGFIGSYVLDFHHHTCDHCGHRWSHLGAFNLGSEPAHTCPRCGQLQWWKCGVPAAIKAMHAHPRAGRAA